MFAVPAGANFQSHGHLRHRFHHRIQNAPDQYFVLQQRRTRHHVADFFGRTAHVDIDDLCAPVNVVPRGFGHHRRVGAGNLHADRIDLAFVVGAPRSLGRTVQQRVRRHHLGHRHARAQLFAKLTERPVGYPGHGGNNQAILEEVGADAHKRSHFTPVTGLDQAVCRLPFFIGPSRFSVYHEHRFTSSINRGKT